MLLSDWLSEPTDANLVIEDTYCILYWYDLAIGDTYGDDVRGGGCWWWWMKMDERDDIE